MKKINLILPLLLIGFWSFGQTSITCTEGEYPSEISWAITSCDGFPILAGTAPFTGEAILPDAYLVNLFDSYGDGWNGAYLIIGEEYYSYVSEYELDFWIDSIGTWPTIFLDTTIDVGCNTVNITELEETKDFTPTEFFDISGKIIKEPLKSGLYIASDGYIRRVIYFHKR